MAKNEAVTWRAAGLWCCAWGLFFAALRMPEWVDMIQVGMLCFILAELSLLRRQP